MAIYVVEQFEEAFGNIIPPSPKIDDDKINALRLSLLREEVDELEEALNKRDTVGVLDALTDIQYVLDGAYLNLGFKDFKVKALLEVHRSNMSKLGVDGKPIYREDGKVLKGPHYSPPDLRGILSQGS